MAASHTIPLFQRILEWEWVSQYGVAGGPTIWGAGSWSVTQVTWPSEGKFRTPTLETCPVGFVYRPQLAKRKHNDSVFG